MAAQASSDRLTPYQRKLFFFLGVATFFEGYDFIALTQILPNLRDAMDLSKSDGGLIYGIINIGTIVAYLLVRRADRWGRRRVLSITIAGYTVCTFLSGFAQDAVQFTIAQLLARTFLIGEYCISMVYAAEEFPAGRRGFVIGMMQAFSSLGGIVCAGVAPLLIGTEYGWRSVYFVGIVPLVLVAVARRSIRESKRFDADAAARPARPLTYVLRTPYGKRVLQLGLIWGLMYLCTNTTLAFWKDFAVNERGLDDDQVGRAITIAALVSMPMIVYAGRLLDVIGRRWGAVVIFGLSALGVFFCYTLHGVWPLTVALIFAIFGVSATLSVLNAYGTELFPTEIRADAFAWSNNLIGRLFYVLAPVGVGFAAESVGWGPAASATSVSLIIAIVLILRWLPETRALELEETSAAEPST